MKYTFFFLTLFIVCFSACKPELTQDFSFLEGSWKMETSDSTYLLESWQKENDKRYTALNYFVSDTGMQLTEEIEIIITDSGTYYMPTIEGLNGGVAFMYKFISQDDNKYVFENEEISEEVNKIWYKLIDDHTIKAGIEGKDGNDLQTFIFEKVVPKL